MNSPSPYPRRFITGGLREKSPTPPLHVAFAHSKSGRIAPDVADQDACENSVESDEEGFYFAMAPMHDTRSGDFGSFVCGLIAGIGLCVFVAVVWAAYR